jgi:hypothetical protein
MKKEKIPDINQENKIEKPNPNSIGELLSIGKDLPTSPDKVYRSVGTKEAINDIEISGIVRNKQSAGLVEKSRWGERVFWSKGDEGKYHSVSQNGFVIEAPLSVAQERIVTKEDITAIYTKNENGEVVDILQQKRGKEEIMEQAVLEQTRDDAQKLANIRKSLGIDE